MSFKMNKICTICNQLLKPSNCRILEVALKDILLDSTIELNIDPKQNSITCNECIDRIRSSFQFKTSCIETETQLLAHLAHLKSRSCSNVKLIEIFAPKSKTDKNARICRLCKFVLDDTTVQPLQFAMSKYKLFEIFKGFLPEIAMYARSDSVICMCCIMSLKGVQKCLSVLYSKSNTKSDMNYQELDINRAELLDEEASLPNIAKAQSVIEENEPNMRTSRAMKLICTICSAEYKYEYHLKKHMKKHTNPTKVVTFKCHICDYETTRKQPYENHLVTHKNPSEREMFKCANCDYQSKTKKTLRGHMIIHRDKSQLEEFSCVVCNFKTTRKCSMKTHMDVHKNKTDMKAYYCTHCRYSTPNKRYYSKHMHYHRPLSELKIHKCTRCIFKTKRKNILNQHILIHQDPLEREEFKCELCSYRTYMNRYLRGHYQRMHRK